ncbi:methylenetetrahydrofolate reductase (NADPH) [Haloarcula vallismortis]|uniref:5,10-methylenetetrahydrofolate reductase n=2 Tax=Haloarcula vallismortis TaxID=28442 RepID=M0JIH7_HALVA|nr:methylenetetrahydrofolate reductase [Haloarcula vallismortis]EMA08806.1 5,10-methylenetetrahydrofolate reductase [Haloarcula vallismortis ATCC 29715]SDX22599.1 methylenetetrahydrofolate reductase (NADPH) [Haloarcula vallismortis]
MALGTRAVSDSQGVQTLLTSARFELMPFESFDEEITHLPNDATIAITTSPQLGIEKTVEKTEQAAAMGYDVVPHVAARYVEDWEQLEAIAERLEQAGITDIFVPGGDREEPAGEYESALDMLEALAETEYTFEEVGITGYPEGHDFIDDETLAESMAQKAPYATYIVTQLCYDPDAVLEWVEDIRGRGIELPVEVGIPGVMNYQRLMQISQKVGVGDSIKFLRKTTGILGFVKQLVGSRGTYEPDELIDGLAPYVGDNEYNIRGVHIYTFNQTPDTEQWRHKRLDS